MKSGAIRILSEDAINGERPFCCAVDGQRDRIYIGTECNSIISISTKQRKSVVVSSGHHQCIVGVALSPKLDSLIATLSEDGLLRLWNIRNASKSDHCVGSQSLISQKMKSSTKANVITWSPDGKYIAT